MFLKIFFREKIRQKFINVTYLVGTKKKVNLIKMRNVFTFEKKSANKKRNYPRLPNCYKINIDL